MRRRLKPIPTKVCGTCMDQYGKVHVCEVPDHCDCDDSDRCLNENQYPPPEMPAGTVVAVEMIAIYDNGDRVSLGKQISRGNLVAGEEFNFTLRVTH